MTATPIHDLLELGHQVKQLRKQQGLSTIDLCKQAGVSRDTLNRLEKGGDVTTSTLLQVLATLHIFIELNHPEAPTIEKAPQLFLSSLLAQIK